MPMSDEFTESRLWHFSLTQLRDTGMPENMRMHVGQVALLRIVSKQMLDRVDGQRTTAGFALEGDKHSCHIGKEILTFFIRDLDSTSQTSTDP